MLIKIDNDRYINSDRIIGFARHPSNSELRVLWLAGLDESLEISEAAANYLCIALEANEGFDSDLIPQATLQSRLASFLRDSADSYTVEHLAAYFDSPIEDTQTYLNALEEEHVVRSQLLYGKQRYFHASNAIGKADLTEW